MALILLLPTRTRPLLPLRVAAARKPTLPKDVLLLPLPARHWGLLPLPRNHATALLLSPELVLSLHAGQEAALPSLALMALPLVFVLATALLVLVLQRPSNAKLPLIFPLLAA